LSQRSGSRFPRPRLIGPIKANDPTLTRLGSRSEYFPVADRRSFGSLLPFRPLGTRMRALGYSRPTGYRPSWHGVMILSSGCPPSQSITRDQPPRPFRGRRLAARAPLRVPSPSAYKVQGARSTRAYHTRHVPPTGFLTLSTASFSPVRPVLFQTGDAHGVPLHPTRKHAAN
jgi:hypothetical protein